MGATGYIPVPMGAAYEYPYKVLVTVKAGARVPTFIRALRYGGAWYDATSKVDELLGCSSVN